MGYMRQMMQVVWGYVFFAQRAFDRSMFCDSWGCLYCSLCGGGKHGPEASGEEVADVFVLAAEVSQEVFVARRGLATLSDLAGAVCNAHGLMWCDRCL